MSVHLVNCDFKLTADTDRPALPEGFTFFEDRLLLMAKGLDGREWFVGKDKLTRAGHGGDAEDASGGKLKPGEIYADDRETIPL